MGSIKHSLLDLINSGVFPLIVSLPANRPELAQAAVDGGADAIKVHIRLGRRASGHRFGTLAEEKAAIEAILGVVDVPVGIVPGAEDPATPEEIAELGELGIDFLDMYWHHLPTYILKGTKIRIAAAIDSDFQYGELSVLTRRQDVAMVEASIMDKAEYGHPLNLRDLVKYELITQKRLLPSGGPLLREVGVKGVILGAVVSGKEPQTIGETVREFKDALS